MNISQLLETLKVDASSLSVGERMIAGVSVAFLAMAVVFIILVLISFIIRLIKYEPKPKNIPAEDRTETSVAVQEEVIGEEHIEELVAVITAAIAASQQTSTNNIVVRRITRTNNTQGSWERMTAE